MILFRPKSMGPNAVNEFIVQFAKTVNLAELTGCVIVVDPNRVRIRKFYTV